MRIITSTQRNDEIMTTTRFVEDYDALRKLDHHAFDIVLVYKRDATKTPIPLIPGGLFVWDHNSLEMDNDSTIILPKTAKGYGKRTLEAFILSE